MELNFTFYQNVKLGERVKVVLFGKLAQQHSVMLLAVLILGFSSTTDSRVLIEKDQPLYYNCSRVLITEDITTEPSPTFPTTSFVCYGRYDGYYADIEVDCTIFHYCQTWQFPSGLNETVKWDFACPQSTIFNQKILSCTPPSISFDCQESPNYYWVNYNLTSTTITPTPTPSSAATIPITNQGQQLIVGGIGPKSNASSDSTNSITYPTSALNSDFAFPNSESRSAELSEEELSHRNESGAFYFS